MFKNFGLEERKSRAFQQRIFLIDTVDSNMEECSTTFIISGTTGNHYQVHVSEDTGVQCSCPDFMVRGNLCKHCLFVLLRVIGIPCPQVEQALVDGHIDKLSSVMCGALYGYFLSREQGRDNRPNHHNVAIDISCILQEDVAQRERVCVAQRKLTEEDTCAICFEEFYEDGKLTQEPLVFCEWSCGQTLHAQCFNKWASTRRDEVQCVYCRHSWWKKGA
jgi:hypothetical protein